MLAAYFDNPQTFLIVKSANPAKDPLLPNATYVMSFADYQQMVDAISSGSIPSYIKWVLYDDEKWPSTPVAQQQQPFTYEAEAQTVAHEHGLGLIFTPAANLTTVLSTAYSNATKYDGYTGLGIASQAAPHADVLEIQAQQDESAPGFNSFVSSVVSQAQATNQRALIMVGLTTAAPRQAAVTPQLLLNDYATTRPLVSGYWLNIPGGRGVLATRRSPWPSCKLSLPNSVTSPPTRFSDLQLGTGIMIPQPSPLAAPGAGERGGGTL